MAKKIKKPKLKKKKPIPRPERKRGLMKKRKPEEQIRKIKIKVIGIGGGGCSIVSEIARGFPQNINFVAANTDLQALRQSHRRTKKFHFGQELTQGLGCGMDPELGKEAAQKAREKIKKIFEGVDFSILISTLGGGTGSGALPIFAEASRACKNITLGIFTLPFKFEGEKKAEIADLSLEKVKPHLNALIIFPNKNIFRVVDKKTSLNRAFSEINLRLAENLKGLLETIFGYGLINIDFADLKTILACRGKPAFLNCLETQGPNRVEEMVRKILQNPLAEYNLQREQKKSFLAEKILFNIFASKNLKMSEVERISQTISDSNPRAKIIFGISNPFPNKTDNKIRILLLAVGHQVKEKAQKKALVPPVLPEKEIKKLEEKLAEKPKKPVKLQKRTKAKGKTKKFALLRKQQKKEVSQKILKRKNALELKKEAEKIEREMLAEEKKWETPAFLRKKKAQTS